MRNKTKQVLLSLALDITRNNIEKRINTTPKNYVKNKTTRRVEKSKTKIVKEDGSVVYFLREKMSGKAFGNMLNKNNDLIKCFLQSDYNTIKL